MKKILGTQPLSARQKRLLPWWAWVLVVGLIALWWLNQQQEQEVDLRIPDLSPKKKPETEKSEGAVTTRARPQPAPPKTDDLRRIEGIGPKVQSLLQEAGIHTYAQLAASDVEHLREILRAARLYMFNPSTWPEQSRLAAEGQWEALEAMQADLKGGRRHD